VGGRLLAPPPLLDPQPPHATDVSADAAEECLQWCCELKKLKNYTRQKAAIFSADTAGFQQGSRNFKFAQNFPRMERF